ncbi:hypothetical protein LCGC14_2681680 [marine sediment metagenome]|uniref:Uncharacterized protein n=1 Tax=marine sediment metagenome TaxID=412755 RepID=A0A0F9BVY4_9ZZZZ
MIINPIKCEGCKEELQPENVMIDVDANRNLIRICGFCGNKKMVGGKRK